MSKKDAKVIVDEYYKEHPTTPIELTPQEYAGIYLGLAVGTIISLFFEERRLKKRVKQLEERVDNMGCCQKGE